jgi:hypothetical protein
MTHKEKLKICKKIHTNNKEIADCKEAIDNNKSSGLDCMNRKYKDKILKLRMENEKHLIFLETGLIIGGSAFETSLNIGDSELEKSFIEKHTMDVLFIVLTLINIYIMMETWK